MLAVPVALPLAALRLLSVTVTRELVELITVRESLDTTNVLPSDKVRVAVTVLNVGRLMGDAAATLLECAIFAALKLNVRTGAVVGDCVVGDDVGACVGGRMIGGGGAVTPAMGAAPAAISVVGLVPALPVVSCTVPVIGVEGKLDPCATVSWMDPTSTSPVALPGAKVPTICTVLSASFTVHVN